jgi:hypothetical protein
MPSHVSPLKPLRAHGSFLDMIFRQKARRSGQKHSKNKKKESKNNKINGYFAENFLSSPSKVLLHELFAVHRFEVCAI